MITEEIIINTLANWLEEWGVYIRIYRSEAELNHILIFSEASNKTSMLKIINNKMIMHWFHGIINNLDIHPSQLIFEAELSDPQSIDKLIKQFESCYMLKKGWESHPLNMNQASDLPLTHRSPMGSIKL